MVIIIKLFEVLAIKLVVTKGYIINKATMLVFDLIMVNGHSYFKAIKGMDLNLNHLINL